MPHSLTKKCPAKNIFVNNKIFCLIGPPLLQNEFRVGMDMGKKEMAAQKNEKKRKKELFCSSHAACSYRGWQQD